MSLISGSKTTNGVIVKWNDQTGYIFISNDGKYVRLTTQDNLKAICWGDTDSWSQEYVDTIKKVHTEVSVEVFKEAYLEVVKSLEEIKLIHHTPALWEQMEIPGIE